MRAHAGVAATLARTLKPLGARVDVEAAVPELYEVDGESVSERFIDLVVQWPGSRRYLIDVTIRSPFAASCALAATRPGVAALGGDKDKLRHYGATVWSMAVEPSGRLSAGALQLLAQLHRESCEYGTPAPGGDRTRTLQLPRLRAQLEAEVIRQDAARSLEALGAAGPRTLGWASSQHWQRSAAHALAEPWGGPEC